MEVSLLDVQGLPPGCLVSVRSGTTRCQAPADPDKMRLFFPKGMKDSFKVDLLAPLGSSEVKYQADANAYPIQVPVNGAIGSLTLAVREMEKPSKPDLASIANLDYTKDEKGRPASPGTASRRHRMALQARSYLDEHQLLMFVQGLLQGLIRDRPQDPWEYINEKSNTAKKVGVAEPYKGTGLTPREGREIPFFLQRLAPTGDTWAKYVSSKPEVDGDGMAVGPWFDVARSAADFEKETPDWSKLDGYSEAGPVDMVIQHLDRLGFAEFTEAIRKAVAYEPPVVKEEPVPEPEEEEWPDANRPHAWKPSVGSWMMRLPDIEPEPVPQGPTAEEILENMRGKVCDAITEASADGRLTTLLQKARDEEQKKLLQRTVESLSKARDDGTLRDISSQMRAMEDLRLSTVNKLTKAASDTSFSQNLQELIDAQPVAPTLQELRAKAAGALLQASQNGRLSEVLSKPEEIKAKVLADKQASQRPLSHELKALKREMRGLLVKSAGDGSFEQALIDVKDAASPCTARLPWYPLPWTERSLDRVQCFLTPRKIETLDSAAAKARQAIVDGSLDGRFLGALQDSQKAAQAEFKEKKAEARGMLLKASLEGSLLQALTETVPPPPVDDEAAKKRKMIQEMLLQAGQDASFLALFQEAADAAGFDLELRPKSPAKPKTPVAGASSSSAPAEGSNDDDIEQLRSQASKGLIEACADGRFSKYLDEAEEEERPSTRGLEVLRQDAKEKLLQASTESSVAQLASQAPVLLPDEATAKQNAREAIAAALLGPEDVSSKGVKDLLPFKDYYTANFACAMPPDLLAMFPGAKAAPRAPEAKASGTASSSVKESPSFRDYYTANFGPQQMPSALLDMFAAPKPSAPAAAAPAASSSPSSLFSSYYSTHFVSSKPVEEMARQLFSNQQEPRSEPPPEWQKQTEVTGPPQPPSPALSAGGFSEIEEKIRQRNDRFRQENDSLRRENRRLKGELEKRPQERKSGPDAF